MWILLSPSKTLDFESPLPPAASGFGEGTPLLFPEKTNALAGKMAKLKPKAIAAMMDLSENLAQLNYERYQQWHYPFGESHTRPAMYAFKGDVFLGLQPEQFTPDEVQYAQNHLRILSGLYGLLRPMDAILPYRLEMGVRWSITPKVSNLYAYWKKELTGLAANELGRMQHPWVLNLASQEYSKAMDFRVLKCPVISPEFKEERGGKVQMISFFAKKARGLMAAWAIGNRIQRKEDLMAFDVEGYGYNAALSCPEQNKWVYTRKTSHKPEYT
jgi:cytoplasmic iron level regulating protein YaaA (DUF328/UPF0246 family)